MLHLQRPGRFTRRRARRVASVLFVAVAAALAPAAAAQAATVSVFPVPGGHVAAPATQITFRGVPASQLGSITVTGSKSGAHTGRIVADSDGNGGSFLPTQPFKAGETVTVGTGLSIAGVGGGTYSFVIANPAGAIRLAGVLPAPRVRNDVSRFISRRDLTPAAFTVTKKASASVAAGGDLFLGAQHGPLQNGPMIIGPYGGLIWFQPVPRNETATDINVQHYQGKPVLTWWQGNISSAGTGSGVDEIYNTSYGHVATVHAANGLGADLHEFTITGRDTALVTAYYPVLWNVSTAIAQRICGSRPKFQAASGSGCNSPAVKLVVA